MRLLRFAVVVVWVLLLFAIGEVALRVAGHEPYAPVVQDVRSTPPGCLVPDPSLGFSLGRGTFAVSVRDDLRFRATHSAFGHRITAYDEVPLDEDDRPYVLVTGGSFTYGYGVDDHESYPFLLQATDDRRRIVNAAAPGHGTVQAILQLDEALGKGRRPSVVIVNYLRYHDARNVLAPSYAQLIRDVFLDEDGAAGALPTSVAEAARQARFPALVDGRIVHVPVARLHVNYPGRTSLASVNLIQLAVDARAEAALPERAATRQALTMLDERCRKHGIRLIVGLLDDSEEAASVADHSRALGLDVVDLSVDYDDDRYTNMPHDWHPSPLAHAHFARQMADAFR